MRRTALRMFVFLVALLCLVGQVRQVKAADIIVNGSFETGDFTGWVVRDLLVTLVRLQVGESGFRPPFCCFTSAPTDESFATFHGFGGLAGVIEVSQDTLIPAGFGGNLTFDWRAGWNMTTWCDSCTGTRTFNVVIKPAGGGAPLMTKTILSAAPQTQNQDTGPNSGTVDLSTFAGTPIRISFEWTVPETFTGPGFFQLDKVALDIQPLDDDNDGILNDDDQCPATPEDEVVDEVGCSISQLCPCENHGMYVSCMVHAAEDFLDAGLISEEEKAVIASEAGRADCDERTVAKGSSQTTRR